ncbi:unnamed protein product, partial [Prunus brigantina]
MLKMHFLSSPSFCVEMVDQIPSKLFVASSISSNCTIVPTSAQLSELEKKNAELVSKLSAEQTRYEKKTSDLRVMISKLKSSLVEKDSELNSSAVDLASQKDAYFHLEHKSVDISHSYDKLLAGFRAYHKSAGFRAYHKSEESNSEATMDTYKLGYLDCTNGNDPFYAIGDKDIKMLCPDLLPVQSEQVNVVNMEGAEEPVGEEAVAEEHGAEEDAADEVVADFIDQACGAAESVAD